MSDRRLKLEDNLEPECALCPPSSTKPIPQKRIVEKMDEYLERQDYVGAERHLLYWLDEACMVRDARGQLFLCNELVGYYRKMNNKEKAYWYGEKALALLNELDFSGYTSAATTYVNYATACNAFGDNEKALGLFEDAKGVYESRETDPSLLGGLYNNMGLVKAALGQYDEAYTLYDAAMKQMGKVENGELEQAITLLNRCNALEAQLGMEEAEERIFALLDEALPLLKKTTIPRDGYYAFVLEKCAPVFEYYGYFMAAEELEAAAKEIYART